MYILDWKKHPYGFSWKRLVMFSTKGSIKYNWVPIMYYFMANFTLIVSGVIMLVAFFFFFFFF